MSRSEEELLTGLEIFSFLGEPHKQIVCMVAADYSCIPSLVVRVSERLQFWLDVPIYFVQLFLIFPRTGHRTLDEEASLEESGGTV